MTATSAAGPKRWQIGHRGPTASGTASRTRCATRSSRWRWRSPSCRRANWRCASPTQKRYFVSEASVYRLLKAHDLITSPAYIVIKAADEFHTKTTAPNQMWQTDFTYFKIIGWGWFYLSTVLDDFSRYIIAWKLCTTHAGRGRHRHAGPGAGGLRLRSGPVRHSRACSATTGPSYIAGELAEWLEAQQA